MPLNLSAAQFLGPALPEPFVKFDLEQLLNQHRLLAKNTGAEGKHLQDAWVIYRRRLRELGPQAGAIRVKNFIIDPLLPLLGYTRIEDGGEVTTREGAEAGGVLLVTDDGQKKLRVWTVSAGTDLEAPTKRGDAYRFSPVKIAQRVLLATQEHLGLITDGQELRILISDAVRPDSQVVIGIETDWRRAFEVPDTFRFSLALASPAGQQVLPELVEKARLKQATVTKELRVQARQAIEGFIQAILDDPRNQAVLANHPDRAVLAKSLWREGLITVYRLLFVLKGEATDDPARSFGFTGSSVWRHTYSPTVRLAGFVRKLVDGGEETGNLIEQGLRMIFKMFAEGISSGELNIAPLGGALFGEHSTPLLSSLHWPERGCATLLDNLLWTRAGRGREAEGRQRIHYGALDIEDLGRVYEALLELEPGIATVPMCRLRRAKLEVVVPAAQGERYRDTVADGDAAPDDAAEDEQDDDKEKKKIEWIEAIPAGRFYLRVGLGRKATGSYYTPHSFVRFLVQETVGAKIDECSPKDDPYPNRILGLKIIDPAMGSGHFLVEACRFIGEKLYEACRLCDDKALILEKAAEKEKAGAKHDNLLQQAQAWRNRVVEIPDPDDEILKYLPSAAPEGAVSGLSERKAQALCKRLAAVHCLYGVDKNPLAVELAKLTLWLESQSEGLPLTFLDHRLALGDSLTGPFFENLLKYPGTQQPLDDMFNQNLRARLKTNLHSALQEVAELNRSVGINLTELTNKQRAKERLEECLLPFKVLAAAWAGCVMLGEGHFDDTAYEILAKHIADTGILPEAIDSAVLQKAIACGFGLEGVQQNYQQLVERIKIDDCAPALPFDLAFPEVFFTESEKGFMRRGFDVVIGNPPWDKMRIEVRSFLSTLNPNFLEKIKIDEADIKRCLDSGSEEIMNKWEMMNAQLTGLKKIWNAYSMGDKLLSSVFHSAANQDVYRLFVCKMSMLIGAEARIGVVIAGGFAKNPADKETRQFIFNNRYGEWLVHFVNTKKIFDSLPPVAEFALLVINTVKKMLVMNIGFDLVELFSIDPDILGEKMTKYPVETVGKMVSEKGLLVFDINENSNIPGRSILEWTRTLGLELQDELNRTTDDDLFIEVAGIPDTRLPDVLEKLIGQYMLSVYAGRNFYQYDDLPLEKNGRWLPQSEFALRVNDTRCRKIATNTRFFRLALRKTCGSPKTNKRSAIGIILRPGCAAGNSVLLETVPNKRPTVNALLALSVINSFALDSIARPHIQANLNQAILKNVVSPNIKLNKSLLIHAALRLTCNHTGYAPLWREQLGDAWRESKPKHTWPVLATDEERWEVRGAIDAVVADAYGLARDQYEHVLSTFSHSSYPPAQQLCLAKFDELKQLGLEAFTKKYDPYWDIPLNEELPKPVIDLPIPHQVAETPSLFGSDLPPKNPRGRKKKA